MTQQIKTAFNAGELSPHLYGRVDLEKFLSAVKTCKNHIIMPHGGVTRRTGTEYYGSVKTASTKVRLVPFEFSKTQAYILEFGDLYMRVWVDAGQIGTAETNTKLLLHLDGPHASTGFADSSASAHAVSGSGSAQLSTAVKKFGSASLKLASATSDYITAPDHVNWFVNQANFTFDLRFFLLSITQRAGIFQQYVDANNYVSCVFRGDQSPKYFEFRICDGGVLNSYKAYYTPTLYTWTHLGIIRGWAGGNGNLAITLNGFPYGNFAESPVPDWPNLAAAFDIGRGYDGTAIRYLDAYLDEVRFLNGTAYWTSVFTPETNQYAVGGTTAYELTTPYSEGHLADLDWCQRADTLFIVHPDFALRKLTRTAHNAWTITEVVWSVKSGGVADRWPPFFPQANNGTGYTLTPSATTGVITITSSAALFSNDDWIGAYIKLHDGFALISDVNSTTEVDATVIHDFTAITATDQWWQSSWDPINGYPSVAMFFENRLGLGSSGEQPHTFWFSETGDHDDWYDAADSDENAVTIDVIAKSLNSIHWALPLKEIVYGTSGGEWIASGYQPGTPLAAGEIPRTRQVSQYGSSDVKAILISKTIMFVERHGRKVRAMQYKFETDDYEAEDLNILANHFTLNDTFVEIAYQPSPHQVLWVITEDGYLYGLTYMPEQNVMGWHSHVLGGTDVVVESIAVIPGDNHDDLWLAVARTVDSGTVRYIEKLSDPFVSGDISEAFFVDSGLSGEKVAEVLTSYTETDASSRIALTSTQVSVVSAAENEDARVYKNFGADYFGLDIDVRFDLKVSALASGGKHYVGAFAESCENLYASFITNSNAGIAIAAMYYSATQCKLRIEQYASGAVAASSASTQADIYLTLGTQYYLKLTRDESVGTFGTVYLYVYSDEDGATQVTGSPLSMPLTAKVDFDYFYPFSTGQSGSAGQAISCILANHRFYFCTVSGLDHLEAETVAILADGVALAEEVVASGVVRLDTSASVVNIGLPYTSDLETLRYERYGKQGTAQGEIVRIIETSLRVYETYGGYIGDDSDGIEALVYATANALYTGDVRSHFSGGYDRNGQVLIRQSDPLPMTILALIFDVEVDD